MTPDRVWENDALMAPPDCGAVPVKSTVASPSPMVTAVMTSKVRPGATPSLSTVKLPR